MMMHEQIENISLRIRWKWDPKFYLPASTMASAPPADNFRTSWSIEQRTFCVQRHQHHNSFKLLETAGKQQSHQSKDRLRMGPTQSWSQPPRFFLLGLPEGSGLQNKPSNYWWAEKKHPNRDGSHWRSNLPRCDVQLHPPHGDVSASGRRTFGATAVGTGYTPVRVLIFYVTVFILIKSTFLNFCFILSIFVIVGFFF